MFLAGVQIVFKNVKSVEFLSKIFRFVGIYFLSAGLVALVISFWQDSFGPSAMLGTATGCGILIGLRIIGFKYFYRKP